MKPFRDAIQTLSEDNYPTVGLAIPILRRIRYALLQQQQKQLENTQTQTAAAAGTTTTDPGDGAAGGPPGGAGRESVHT